MKIGQRSGTRHSPFPVLMSAREIDRQSEAPTGNSQEPNKPSGAERPFEVLLRDAPAIANKIELLWGSPSLPDLIELLAFESRGKPRETLTPATFEAILALGRLHKRKGGTPRALWGTAREAAD